MLRDLHFKDAVIVLVILVAAGGYAAWVWLAPKPEEEIRASLRRLVEAAETADYRALSMELAPDYSGELASREELLELAQQFFEDYGPTKAVLSSVQITVQGQLGLAEVALRTQAQNRARWGAEADSSWRLSYAQFGGRWYIEDIVPLSFMGKEVRGFRFRTELRELAERELAEATKRLEQRARRVREEGEDRFERLRRQREAMAQDFPAEEDAWLLDDFESRAMLWSPEDWGHPVKMSAVPFEGSRRLKLEVGRSGNEKAAIGRAVLMDFSSRGAVRVDAWNDTEHEAQIALAVMAQSERGHFAWYETPLQPLPPGENRDMTFDLLARDFKTQRTRWRHRAAIPSRGNIARVFFLIYTNLGGTFYLDNVVALRGADDMPPAAPPPADDDAPEPEE